MADPNFNQNILNAQKKLNELYQGQKGFLESPENGYLTQASFVSLLTALQIEKVKAFPDFKTYSVSDLLNYWSIKPAMRHQFAQALHDGRAMFNSTNTTQLMEIALGLHGENVDLNKRMLSGSAISDESQFAQDLGIDMEGWGMDSEHISFIAMLSPINVLIKNDSNKHNSIRRAQKAMNKILSNLVNDQDPNTYSLNPVNPKKCKIKSKKFLFDQSDFWQEEDVLLNDTDGVNDQATFRSLQRVMQYFQVQDGYSDISFDEYVHNHFTMQFGDRDRIVWIGLALAGYLLINYDDFYNIPYEERHNVTYPFNKTLYLQSIVRNSIKGRHNEFYLITCYDQKTINSTRRWTYPIMNSKDVQVSDIVEHKNIATHYDNFLDTSILTYHMLDFERYNKYRNAYRFMRDPQTDFSSPVQEIAGTPDSKTTKETVYDAILPPIDTAQENLNNETGKKVATQIQNSVNDYKKRWKGCSTVDDVFNLSHNTTSYVLPRSDNYLK